MHPTGGSLRVFRHFAWLEVGSVKVALSRPAHQRVTPAVRQPKHKNERVFESPSRFFVSNSKFILWVGQFLFSGGSGFQIVGLVSFTLAFQFSFLALVKVLVNFGL